MDTIYWNKAKRKQSKQSEKRQKISVWLKAELYSLEYLMAYGVE